MSLSFTFIYVEIMFSLWDTQQLCKIIISIFIDTHTLTHPYKENTAKQKGKTEEIITEE